MKTMLRRQDLVAYMYIPAFVLAYLCLTVAHPLLHLALRCGAAWFLLLAVAWIVQTKSNALGGPSKASYGQTLWRGWICQVAVWIMIFAEMRAAIAWMPPEIGGVLPAHLTLTPMNMWMVFAVFVALTMLSIGSALTKDLNPFLIKHLREYLRVSQERKIGYSSLNVTVRFAIIYMTLLALVSVMGLWAQRIGWLQSTHNIAWLLWMTPLVVGLYNLQWQRWLWRRLSFPLASCVLLLFLAGTQPVWRELVAHFHWQAGSEVLWTSITQQMQEWSSPLLLPFWGASLIVCNAFLFGWATAKLWQGKTVLQILVVNIFNPLILAFLFLWTQYPLATQTQFISFLTSDYLLMCAGLVFAGFLVFLRSAPGRFLFQHILEYKQVAEAGELPWFWYTRILMILLAMAVFLWNGVLLLMLAVFLLIVAMLLVWLFPTFVWCSWQKT